MNLIRTCTLHQKDNLHDPDFPPSCKIIRLAWLPQDLLRKKEEERRGGGLERMRCVGFLPVGVVILGEGVIIFGGFRV